MPRTDRLAPPELEADVASRTFAGAGLTVQVDHLGLLVQPDHGSERRVWWEEVRRVSWVEYGHARLWLLEDTLDLDQRLPGLRELVELVEHAAAQVREAWQRGPLGGPKLASWFGDGEIEVEVITARRLVGARQLVSHSPRWRWLRAAFVLAWALLVGCALGISVLLRLEVVCLFANDPPASADRVGLVLLCLPVVGWLSNRWRQRLDWALYDQGVADEVECAHTNEAGEAAVERRRARLRVSATELAWDDCRCGWSEVRAVRLLGRPQRVELELADAATVAFVVHSQPTQRAFALLADLLQHAFHADREEPPPATGLSRAAAPEHRRVAARGLSPADRPEGTVDA